VWFCDASAELLVEERTIEMEVELSLRYIKLTQVYTHHPCEKTPDGRGFLLNHAKDLLR